MSVADFWSQTAREGRAVIVAYPWGDPRLWLVRIGDEFVRCDDSDSGHLLAVTPTDDVDEIRRRWTMSRGSYQCHHDPSKPRKRAFGWREPTWVNPRRTSVQEH